MAERQGRTGLVALPVAVLLLALLTVWVVVFSREEGTAEPDDLVAATTTPTTEPAALAQLWGAPIVPAAIDDAGLRATRLWAHDGTVTLVSTAGVTGYDTVDGTPLWQAATPPGAGVPCAAAEGTNASGVGAVLYRAAPQDGEERDEDENGVPGAGCTVLGVIDTTSGALLWSEPLTEPETGTETGTETGPDAGSEAGAESGSGPDSEAAGEAGAADITLTVGDQTVTVNLDGAGTVSAFHRLALDDGDALGTPQPPADPSRDCAVEREPEAVRHAGSRVAVLTRCESTAELSVYHADTGELEWTHPATDPEFAFTGILAGDPLTLFQGDELVAYSETGEELWRRVVDAMRPEMSAVVGDVLCVREGGAGFAGYDVAGGEQLWESELDAGTQLFGVQDDRLLLGRPDGDELLRLTRLDPADGTEAAAGTVQLDPQRSGEARFMAWDEHQLYVMATVEGDETQGLRLRAFER
jgi:hypothetical protein